MWNRHTSLAALFSASLAISLAAAGCAPKIEPQIQSPAGESAYATNYPDALAAAVKGFDEAEQEAKDVSGKMSGFADALKSPPYKRVLEIADAAEASGKSQAYVDARREHDATKKFYDEEKDELVRKVAGAAAFAAKAKDCNVDVSGAVQHALKEAMEKRIEKRFHDASEAHALIDRYENELGKDNVGPLGDQADQIAAASYDVNIVMVEHKLRVLAMIQEGEAIKKTLERAIAAERAAADEPKLPAAEKKAAEERIERMKKASALVDSAVTQAKGVSERLEPRVQEAQKGFNDAFGKLRADLQKRAGG